ncbi:Hypothetical aminotransferase [Mycobacteroides abscessus]|nr:Hypothetical aminotransferase [Mycobacteroides abscessus]
MTRFGYTLMTEQSGPKDLVRYAVAAEKAGFDFEVSSDHYSPWLSSQGHAPYAWSVLGAVAQATERVDLATYVTCPTMRYHPAVVAATMPTPIDQVMYACTGSEANDLALRVAQRYTGHKGIVVTSDAYHGNTAAVTAISPSLGGNSLGPHVRTVAPPDSYRTPPGELAERFAADVSHAIDELCAAGYGFSCLVVDTIFSSDGIYPDASVLEPAAEVVRAAGGVLIADEVQPGFGRTGEAWWGFIRHGVVPDLVTMGKPMANGIPVSALTATSEVLAPFAQDVPYFNTFGGNPVSMAAAAAVMDVIEDEELQLHAAEVGAMLRTELRSLASTHVRLGDVRGTGLYTGVEVVDDPAARTPDRAGALHIVNELRNRRVLISVCGQDGNVLKIRPPLVFSRSDVDWFCTELDDVLKSTG